MALGPVRGDGFDMVMTASISEIEFVLRFKESSGRESKFWISYSDADHTFSCRVTDVPTGELLWSKTRACNGAFLSGPIEDYVSDCLEAFVRLSSRLPKTRPSADD